MTDEKKKEFQLRLSQCNSSGMIVIEYDIFYAYLEDALDAFELGGEDYRDAIRHADAVLKRLEEALDFKYDIAREIFPLYTYSRRQLSLALALHKKKHISNAKNVIDKLYDAFSKIAQNDDSPAIMQHTQQVYTGYTYGKDSMNTESSDIEARRGFWV